MILLLDEDDSFRREVARRLREGGYGVAEFDTVKELESFGAHDAVSAVVLGAESGGRDLSVADHLHACYPNAPIVIATTCRELAALPDVHTRDYLYCFCKPVTASALSRVLDVLLPVANRAA